MQENDSDACKTITITQATAVDFSTCADIWLESSLLAHDFIAPDFWKNHYDAMLHQYLPSSRIIIASKQRRIAAFAALTGEDLAALFVDPTYWGQGIGSALLCHAQEQLDQLHLKVYKKNIRAVTFYHRHNFQSKSEGSCRYTGEQEFYMVWQKNSDRHFAHLRNRHSMR